MAIPKQDKSYLLLISEALLRRMIFISNNSSKKVYMDLFIGIIINQGHFQRNNKIKIKQDKMEISYVLVKLKKVGSSLLQTMQLQVVGTYHINHF